MEFDGIDHHHRLTGARVVGMCSNAGAVLWYLVFSRHEHIECPYGVQKLGDSLQDEATIDDSDSDYCICKD